MHNATSFPRRIIESFSSGRAKPNTRLKVLNLTRQTVLGDCVEVARNLPGAVAVRDSKDPGGPKLVFTPDEWRAFTAGVTAGEFDLH